MAGGWVIVASGYEGGSPGAEGTGPGLRGGEKERQDMMSQS
jgi:hypothetical protein